MQMGDALLSQIRLLANHLGPHLRRLEREANAQLKQDGLDRQAAALVAQITSIAAARRISENLDLRSFLEHVEHAGKLLAKRNVPANRVIEYLNAFDRRIEETIASAAEEDRMLLEAARQQLVFSILVRLNEAYYSVREIEALTFLELSRIEHETREPDLLLQRSLDLIRNTFHAQSASIFLLDDAGLSWLLRASSGKFASKSNAPVKNSSKREQVLSQPKVLGKKSTADILDEAWPARFPCVWSLPMMDGDRITGVLQLAFESEVEWLPRDADLITAACERCLSAAQRSKLVHDLAAREEQIRRLAEHMLQVEEMERRRISRELHDDAGQSLVTIRLQMEMIEMSLPEESTEIATRLAEVRDVTERTILEIRRLIADLSPVVLEQFGVEAAIRQLIKRLQSVQPCTVKLNTENLDTLPQRLQMIVYRILQECCNNIGKHSGASHVNISVCSADGVLSLEVRDNGQGFQVQEAFKKADSFGLAGMRERVALLGGKFTIQSHPSQGNKPSSARNRGTEIRIQLPLSPENRRN